MVFHSQVINSCILLILLHGKETVNKHFYFQRANRSSHFEAGIDTVLDALISDSTLCFLLSICCHFFPGLCHVSYKAIIIVKRALLFELHS